MDERIKFFVGLDVHKDTVSIAACESGSREPARLVGTVSSDVQHVLKVLDKAGEPGEVSVVYEAGPTGFGLYRELCSRSIAARSPRPERACQTTVDGSGLELPLPGTDEHGFAGASRSYRREAFRSTRSAWQLPANLPASSGRLHVRPRPRRHEPAASGLR